MNTVTHNELKAALLAIVNVVPKIDYNPKWANGTGYLDHASKDLDATVGHSVVASVDENGRRILLCRIETEAGPRNVVFFERYGDHDQLMNKNLIIAHAPLEWFYEDGVTSPVRPGQFSAKPVMESTQATNLLLAYAAMFADFSLSEYRRTVLAIENSLVAPVPFDELVKQNRRKRIMKRIGISIGVAMVAVGTYKFLQSLGVDVLEEIPTEG